MDSGAGFRRPLVDAKDLERQLNALRQEFQSLQHKLEESAKENKIIIADRDELSVSLEQSRAEIDEHRQYYSKWKSAQQELDETQKAIKDAKEERDESRKALEELQAIHKATVTESKKRETALSAAHQAKMDSLTASAKQDFSKMKRMKAEILSLRKQLEGNGTNAQSEVDKENMHGQEMHVQDENAVERRSKRNFEAAFPDPDDTVVDEQRHSPNARMNLDRHPLSDKSRHNSPSSRRINKRPNLRHDVGPESPLRKSRVDVQVSKPNRILAKETQSEDEDQETQETIPLDFDDVKDVSMDANQPSTKPRNTPTMRPLGTPKSEKKPFRIAKAGADDARRDVNAAPRTINLHDKTNFVPLVSPDTETASINFVPSEPQKETADQLRRKVMSDGGDRAAEDKQGKSVATASRKVEPSSTRLSDRNEQIKIKREPSPSRNHPTSVTREALPYKAERDVKFETPLGSRVGSRSSTPATGSADRRKLLPIPGWKGGRSSRALAKKDSFEDDDGLGYQTSLQASTVKRMKETPMSISKPDGGHEDSPLQAKKYTRPAKHGAIPAHMATEMTRSRTSGSPAEGSTNRSSRSMGGKPDAIHSDPVQEHSRTRPLADRDRNIPRRLDLSKNADVKVSRQRDESRRMASSRTEEKGFDGDSAVAGSSKGNQGNAEKYEINPDRNHGLNYAYHEVERRKEERKKLAGHGCIECENYYNAVGEMPVISRAPIWRSPSPESKRREIRMASRKCPHGRHVREGDGAGHEDDDDGNSTTEEGKQRVKNQISRHREDWTAPSTPPMYWNIGFPSTQDVVAINEEAERQKEAKRAEMRREAEKKDGKYRRVAD